MAVYLISGVWENLNNIIIAYSFHKVNDTYVDRAIKRTKAEAIAFLELQDNSATTWVWNYDLAKWAVGESVQVVNGPNGKYLRSNPDKQTTDNLTHLIDFDWIFP
jgi:hypothetical protein